MSSQTKRDGPEGGDTNKMEAVTTVTHANIQKQVSSDYSLLDDAWDETAGAGNTKIEGNESHEIQVEDIKTATNLDTIDRTKSIDSIHNEAASNDETGNPNINGEVENGTNEIENPNMKATKNKVPIVTKVNLPQQLSSDYSLLDDEEDETGGDQNVKAEENESNEIQETVVNIDIDTDEEPI